MMFLSLPLSFITLAHLPSHAFATGTPYLTSPSTPAPSATGNLPSPFQHRATSCTALASKVSQLIPGYPVSNIVNEILPANSTFDQGTQDYNTPVVNLPELCRFGAYFNTSSESAVKFEVWMPTHGWNGRLAFNGGVCSR
jgi:feruloyl esterase